jgi:hypothetical protein
MKYRIVIQKNAIQFDNYEVYSHSLSNNCLILDLGYLNNGAKEEKIVPVTSFIEAWTEEID